MEFCCPYFFIIVLFEKPLKRWSEGPSLIGLNIKYKADLINCNYDFQLCNAIGNTNKNSAEKREKIEQFYFLFQTDVEENKDRSEILCFNVGGKRYYCMRRNFDRFPETKLGELVSKVVFRLPYARMFGRHF